MKIRNQLIALILAMSLTAISCGGSYSVQKEKSLGDVLYLDESKTKKKPLIIVKKDNENNIILSLKEKRNTPQYKAENIQIIQETGKKSEAGKWLEAGPGIILYLPLILSTQQGRDSLTGTKESETIIGKTKRNEEATGNIKEEILPLHNHPVTVRVNGLLYNNYLSNKEGIVKIPIKALLRKQPDATEKLEINLSTDLDGETAQQNILLTKEDLRQIALDSIMWNKDSLDTVPSAEVKDYRLGSVNGFELIQGIVKKRIAVELEQYRELPQEIKTELSNLKSSQPVPPKLEKDQFESTSNFQKRVAEAKVEYDREVTAYNKRVQALEPKINTHQEAKRELPLGIRNQIIEDTFLEVFGRPKIANPRYDADTEMFFMDIVSDSNFSGGFKRTLSLAENIPNAKARDFFNSIKTDGEPVVQFKLNRGQILWDNASVIVKGKTYAANPTNVVFQPMSLQTQIAEAQVLKPVDLKDYTMNTKTAADMVQVTLQQDPEIAKLQREIYERKKEKIMSEAKREEISRLEEDLKRLKSVGDEKEAPFGSVDLEQNIPEKGMINKGAVAVVIGNYDYKKVPKVTFARRDAAVMKEYLVKIFGYDPGNIIFLLDATLSDILNAFGNAGNAKRSKLSSYLRPGSEIFVYYTGHGAPGLQDKKGYLVPIDADPNNIETTGYSLETLYRNLESLNAAKLTVVIDACFSGDSQAGMLFKDASPIMVQAKSDKLNTGTVITSSSGDQISSWYPEKKHSLFTYYFLMGIREKASKKETVTLSDLKEYVLDNVDRMAKRLYNRIQTPNFDGNLKEGLIDLSK